MWHPSPSKAWEKIPFRWTPCDSVRFPNHMTLLGRNFLNTENLKDLDQLIGRPFTFVTLPLKFENADGCSCLAVAITEEE